MSHEDHADDDLLGELREALAQGTPDGEATARAACAAFTWRTVDAELASLAYDSLLDDRALVRGGVLSPRRLVFDAGDTVVEVEIIGGRALGQIVPSRTAGIDVLSPSAEATHARADEAGCFIATLPPAGPFRLRCRTDLATVVTDWVTA